MNVYTDSLYCKRGRENRCFTVQRKDSTVDILIQTVNKESKHTSFI